MMGSTSLIRDRVQPRKRRRHGGLHHVTPYAFLPAQFPDSPIPRLGEQSLRKIYPLREFRHFAPQLVDRRGDVLVP